jgi:hypothetical protein
MKEFLAAIPSAAASPYALIAYAIAAVLMIYGGFQWRMVKELSSLKGKEPNANVIGLIQRVIGNPEAPVLSETHWLAFQWMKIKAALATMLIVVIGTIAVIALARDG